MELTQEDRNDKADLLAIVVEKQLMGIFVPRGERKDALEAYWATVPFVEKAEPIEPEPMTDPVTEGSMLPYNLPYAV